MREIRFRAKRKLNGDWVYGSLVRHTDEDWDSIIPEYDGDLIDCDNIRVITNTIGQFTGLKDKNGKEIYEGDIISVEHCECVGHDPSGNEIWEDCKGPVSFEDGSFIFDGHSAGSIPLQAYIEYCEVIGNIHEHKHLLK